jgi:DNA-binding winged helix-turn-helix (wHTH) protein/TolB-like protein/tetratricopeptide (TPR) repeat protein
MRSSAPSKHSYHFGLFEARPASRELLRRGARVRLQDQAFRVLAKLLEHPGEVVTRQDLRQMLWPEDTFVDFDGSLNAILKRLRAALGDDPENPRFIETVPKHGYRFIAPVSVEQPVSTPTDTNPPTDSPPPQAIEIHSKKKMAAWLVGSVIVVMLVLAGWKYTRKPAPNPHVTRKVIAVLPLTNEGAGPDFDYLRYAIANDLVTDLTYTPSVSVRPFASTSRYAAQPFDPATVGGELRVTHVVAGGFLLENKNLRVNLELVDVARNQPVWRDEITVSPSELIALHDQLAFRAAQGMLPAINVSGAPVGVVPSPKNEEALDLFLHSLTIPLDPEPNRLAIQKLEQSVSLDSGYAPAWEELGWRYYVDFHYGSGNKTSITKSLQAYKRQSELDPDTPSSSVNIRVEQGDLNGAYDQAASFLVRRSDSSAAHFEMSYVLRYAGLLDEAGKECDAALALDPGFNGLRSCALPFIMTGDYAHAQRYINLDERFGALMRLRIALRSGNTGAILAEIGVAADSRFRAADVSLAFYRSCIDHAPEAELSSAAAKLEADPVSLHDPELQYQNAESLAFCGQTDAALRELAKAVKGNHCSYPAMDKDPLFNPIRQRPEFADIRQSAIQCEQNFLGHREQVDSTLALVR